MMRWSHILMLSAALLTVGCSTSSKELPPAELTKFTEEVHLEKQWSRSIGNGQGESWNQLELASADGNLFAAAAEGTVVAMDRETGKVLWETELKQPISGGVGAVDDLVLVGTAKGQVVALDSRSGEQKWRVSVGSEVLSAPVGSNGIIVVQTQDDRLVGIDAYEGRVRWQYGNTPAVLTLRGTATPLIAGRLAIAGLSSGKVIAVDILRGIPVWEERVAVPKGRSELERIVDIDGNLLLSGDTLYVVTYQGNLAALEASTGRTRWQRPASSYTGLASSFGTLYLSQATGALEGIDARSSTQQWINDKLARRQLSGPALFSSNIAVGDVEGYLHLMSQVDGRFVGRERVDSDGLRARPLVVGGWLYAYGNSGKLVAYTLR